MYTTISLLFQTTRQTVYNWKREQRPIITLITKYFTKGELEEFLNTGHIARLESKSQSNSISNSTIQGSGIMGFGDNYQTPQKNKKKNELELKCEPLTQVIFNQLCEVFVNDEEELQKILLELLHDKKKQLLSI